jgi:hypothetical protein
MEIPVLVEMLPDKGFRARAGDPFCFCAEAKTQPEALEKLRKLIEERRKAGAWIVHLDIGNIDNPIMLTCGTLDPDDPLTKEWEAEMAEYRKERNKELEDL